jgi:hypothetical protein
VIDTDAVAAAAAPLVVHRYQVVTVGTGDDAGDYVVTDLRVDAPDTTDRDHIRLMGLPPAPETVDTLLLSPARAHELAADGRLRPQTRTVGDRDREQPSDSPPRWGY